MKIDQLPTPSKIVGIGRNYADHAKELGNDAPAEPLIFLKAPSSLLTPNGTIIRPSLSQRVDFEGELAIVIGREAKNIRAANWRDVVQGFTCANDVTARDLQKKDSQWTRAKGFDTFCPIGTVSNGSHDLSNLTVVTRVNGVEKQRASSNEMVFSIGKLLSYVSHVMTLDPGDIVATGTPSGVGPLTAGDVVEIEVVGVSKVSNPVEARA